MELEKWFSILCICVIPLYTEQELNSAKCNDLLPCQCTVCQSTFYKRKRVIQRVLRNKGNVSGNYCSSRCGGIDKATAVDVSCKHCGKTCKRIRSQVKKVINTFCSSTCAATYNNTHKTHGTRRSKLEIWLEQQLPVLYPFLEFYFNRKDAINAELDIYIPALKLAFELNGLFHYEPIFGADKLAQIQNNDQRKYQACIERGIELCLIDVSSFKNFKENGAVKYLNIIKDILNLKVISEGFEPPTFSLGRSSSSN